MSERYERWVKTVPEAITDDPLWRVEAYRLAMFVADVAWDDIDALSSDPRTLDNSDQLYRALCSIGANVSEGYSRESGRDRARFYGYALGSAREARGFYFHGRRVIGDDVAFKQIGVLSQIIRLLFTMVRDQRERGVSEDETTYWIDFQEKGSPRGMASDGDPAPADASDSFSDPLATGSSPSSRPSSSSSS